MPPLVGQSTEQNVTGVLGGNTTDEGVHGETNSNTFASVSGIANGKGSGVLGISDFTNQNSMLTPGIAGGMTMVISGAVNTQLFDLHPPQSAVIHIIISFIFGLLVMGDKTIIFWKRLIYWFINSLIIFTVSVGSNTVSHGVTAQDSGIASNAWRWITPISVAHAQQSPRNGWCCLNRSVAPSSIEECSRRNGRFFSVQADAQQVCNPAPKPDHSFFRPVFR